MIVVSMLACSQPATVAPRPGVAEPIELRIDYGSEKRAWLDDAITAFLDTRPALPSGRPIRISARALGSGEAVDDIVAGRSHPHAFSPASSAYVSLLDDAWLSIEGHTRPLCGPAEPLVLSPVVIAAWRPMAEALGWPDQPIRWADLLAISTDPAGWGSRGHPEWGRFKLGHTHPELSNSGLLAVLSETYAATGLTRGLTSESLAAAEPFVSGVEATLVHYGKSTGFFTDKMLERGPDYVSAVVSYENLVVDSYRGKAPRRGDIVALYPAEGTFWSDHPLVVLDAEWVGDDERAAAAMLRSWLLGADMQRKALTYGFRPADPSIAVGAPIDAAHGVDPSQPKTLLEIPDAKILNEVLALWKLSKKASDVVLLLDKSGSMSGEPLQRAQAGAREFLRALTDRDMVSVVFFDDDLEPVPPARSLGGGGRDALISRIDAVNAGGGTPLYDALQSAIEEADRRAEVAPAQIHAVVVLTDGRDENSRIRLEQIQAALRARAESRVLLFTIGYGQAADPDVLGKLAEAGRGATAMGQTEDISTVFLDMAAFF